MTDDDYQPPSMDELWQSHDRYCIPGECCAGEVFEEHWRLTRPTPAPAPRATVTREQLAEAMYQAMTSFDIRECALACADVAMALLTTPAEKDGAE